MFYISKVAHFEKTHNFVCLDQSRSSSTPRSFTNFKNHFERNFSILFDWVFHRDCAFFIKNLKIKWYIKWPKYTIHLGILNVTYSPKTLNSNYCGHFDREVNDFTPTIRMTFSGFSSANFLNSYVLLNLSRWSTFNDFIVYSLVFSLCFKFLVFSLKFKANGKFCN